MQRVAYFMIRMHCPDVGGEPWTGLAEHLETGRKQKFTGIGELLTFMGESAASLLKVNADLPGHKHDVAAPESLPSTHPVQEDA